MSVTVTLQSAEGSKASETLGTKDTVKNLSNADDTLNHEDAKRVQSRAVKLNGFFVFRILIFFSLRRFRDRRCSCRRSETGIVMSGMAKASCRRHGTSDAGCAATERVFKVLEAGEGQLVESESCKQQLTRIVLAGTW